MSDDLESPENDPFGPPAVPTEVACLHCGREYDSFLIEWRIEECHDGKKRGFWCCPTPGCDGRGFGFDILPTDPNYQDEHGGWIHDSDEDDEDFDEEGFDEFDDPGFDPTLEEPGPSANGKQPHPPPKDVNEDDLPF